MGLCFVSVVFAISSIHADILDFHTMEDVRSTNIHLFFFSSLLSKHTLDRCARAHNHGKLQNWPIKFHCRTSRKEEEKTHKKQFVSNIKVGTTKIHTAC